MFEKTENKQKEAGVGALKKVKSILDLSLFLYPFSRQAFPFTFHFPVGQDVTPLPEPRVAPEEDPLVGVVHVQASTATCKIRRLRSRKQL